MKVLACAVGFGLGPNGKLCSIINYNPQYEWYACGDELDLSIYKENPFVDICWSKDEKKLEDFVKKYKIKYAVDVLDPDLAVFFKNIGIEVIYVDSLPFMWTEADLIPYNVDYYCAQKYPDYSINPVLKRVENFVWVNPIALKKMPNRQQNGIVINFGGLHSPFGEGKEYFEIIMNALLFALPNQNFHIVGGRNVIKLTKKLFPNLRCDTYTHEEFLKLVSGAKIFITSPGLTTIYETCGMDVKTIILPPQNLSQFYNTLIAEKVCKRVKILNWNYRKLDLDYLKKFKDKPEEETVKYIYEQIRNLYNNKNYRIKFNQYLSTKLNDDSFKINKVENFCGSGVIEISEILNKMVEGDVVK